MEVKAPADTVPEANSTVPVEGVNARHQHTLMAYEKLSHIIHTGLSFTFQQFLQEVKNGQLLKKRALTLLVSINDSKVKKMFGKWATQRKEVPKDQPAKQREALIRLESLLKSYKADVLNRWRQVNGQCKVKAECNKQGKEAEYKAWVLSKSLSNLVQNTLKESWNGFRTDYLTGQESKKRAILRLFATTTSEQKKVYTRWNKIPV